MGRPTHEAPTRAYTHKHTQTHTNRHEHTDEHTQTHKQTRTNTQRGPTKYGAGSRPRRGCFYMCREPRTHQAANAGECRAAQSRQARPEEAQGAELAHCQGGTLIICCPAEFVIRFGERLLRTRRVGRPGWRRPLGRCPLGRTAPRRDPVVPGCWSVGRRRGGFHDHRYPVRPGGTGRRPGRERGCWPFAVAER